MLCLSILFYASKYIFFLGRAPLNGVHSTKKVKNPCFKGLTPVEAKYSAPVQTSPGAYPVSCTMNTGCFPGVKRPGRGVDLLPQSTIKV